MNEKIKNGYIGGKLPLWMLFIFLIFVFFLDVKAEDSGDVDENGKKKVCKISPEIQKEIDEIKKLSEDEAFAELDRSVKMGNKTRLMVTLYVYPKLLNRKDRFGRTPLYNAVFAQKEDIVHYLLSKRASVSTPDAFADTPLHRAAAGSSAKIVEMLLKYGAHFYTKNKKGRTPIFNAASQGRIEIAKVLLDAGDNVHRKDSKGDTPLHLAAFKGKTKMVKFLLQHGADADAKNKKGKTPAELTRSPEIREMLKR